MGLENKLVSQKIQWRAMPHIMESASWNLAVDHALLEVMNYRLEKGENVKPIIRTYQFDKPSIILGRRENSSKFNGKEYELTMRMSGGGHMYYCPNDLHVSTILPLSIVPSDYIESYHFVNTPIVNALKNLGYPAKLGRTSIKMDLDNERAFMGNAQRRLRYAMLQHGSILVNDYDDFIFGLVHATLKEIEVWKKRVATISMLDGNANGNAIVRAITESAVGDNYAKYGMDNEEKELAQKLHEEKYTNPEFVKDGINERGLCLLHGLITDDYDQHFIEHTDLGDK